MANVLTDSLFKHRSSIDCVNHLLSVINENLQNGKKVMGIFMDLEDAFLVT